MFLPISNTNILLDQARKFPINLCATIPIEQQQTIIRWLFQSYVWPQIWERQPFEEKWDRLHQMYRIQETKKRKIRRREADRDEDPTEIKEDHEIGDTIIFDTVDRLKNLNHFISWKDNSPVQFNKPRFLATPLEDEFYSPTSRKLQGANALLEWNIANQNVYLKHLLACQHFHLYGLAFVISEFEFRAVNDFGPDGQPTTIVDKVGVTFEPTSIRKVWLNYRIPLHEMHRQPCPFWFNVMPRFVAQQNQYDPVANPHGFANLDRLGPGQYLMGTETSSWLKTMEGTFPDDSVRSTLLKPEFSTEARWTFCPMIPMDDDGNFDPTGITIPAQRFIIEVFAANLSQGSLTPVRIQKMFYPKKLLPIYGASHIPDLDSGAYAPAIGEILETHYDTIVKAKNQYLLNKDWINDPPSWFVSGSPAANQDLNKRGAKVEVLGPNDFGWRVPYDATGSTVNFMDRARDAAQTTGKAVDALLGKAMGSRTTATEASNAFQAAMSGATTDINLFNNGIMCPYAERTWFFCAYFMDPDLLRRITGAYGESLSPEDMNINIGISRDIGSTFIESIVKQQHLRYALEAATRSPYLRQDVLWKEFFKELRMPGASAAVQDGGFEFQVSLSTNQAIETYLGRQIMINPNQDHDVAIRVKTRFLEDHDSTWNREYAALPAPPQIGQPPLARSQALVLQIQLHQQFQFMIQQQQMLDQQIARLDEATLTASGIKPKPKKEGEKSGSGSSSSRIAAAPTNGGDVASGNGGRLM